MAHKTYIRDVKGAKTAVLFIHGFLGSPEHFEKFISVLPEDVAVYNFLLKGHGGSVRDFAKASMKEWKKQVDDTLKQIFEKYRYVIIVGHSMGTLFAVEAANRYKNKVKQLFLLQTPLKIAVKPNAAINTLKSLFNLFPEDEIAKAYKNAHSVKLNLRLWEYIGWIPRYLELFEEAKKARDEFSKLNTPCIIFQSAKDELVSIKSVKYIPQKDGIELNVLKNSAHFIYDEKEYSEILKIFKMIF